MTVPERRRLEWFFVSARPSSVAVLQLRANDRDRFVEHWPFVRARIAEAAQNGAELIVLPEGTVPAYVIGAEPVDRELLADAASDVIAIAARSGATIVYGSGRYEGERFFNSAYVATADGIVGTADKCFLWHFDRRWFTAGERLEPVSTPVGRLGIMVCQHARGPWRARPRRTDGLGEQRPRSRDARKHPSRFDDQRPGLRERRPARRRQ
jgi:predicted amidohydrolase